LDDCNAVLREAGRCHIMPSRLSVHALILLSIKTACSPDKPVFINAILPRKRAFYQKKYDQSVLATLSLQCPDFHLSVAG
jgi:hypothetical protein